MTIQIGDVKQFFLMVIFIMLYIAVLSFESMDEFPKCDHSNESCCAVVFRSTAFYVELNGSNFWVRGWSPGLRPVRLKLFGTFFLTLFVAHHFTK